MHPADKNAMSPVLEMVWKTAKLYSACFAGVQSEYGLTANERDVLLFLYNNKGYDTAADIVKYRSISKSLVSKSVESLTMRGYLEAEQDAGDRRHVHLRIVPEMIQVVERLADVQQDFLVMLGKGLTEVERGIFRQALKKMGDNADRYFQKE